MRFKFSSIILAILITVTASAATQIVSKNESKKNVEIKASPKIHEVEICDAYQSLMQVEKLIGRVRNINEQSGPTQRPALYNLEQSKINLEQQLRENKQKYIDEFKKDFDVTNCKASSLKI